jgi:uncharacterized OB-fold protein
MSRPLRPTVSADTAFFWEALKEGRLVVQKCSACGRLRHPPGPMCPQCHSLSWAERECSGLGEVYSFVMPQHPQYPWCDYPYVVALIELVEGIRIVSNVCGVLPEEVNIGMPVQVSFAEFDDGLVLHQFLPANS